MKYVELSIKVGDSEFTARHPYSGALDDAQAIETARYMLIQRFADAMVDKYSPYMQFRICNGPGER